ncbi:flavodoxin family protein [Amorphoplanes nipponensis]|uniref:Flavodoxin n=1 Tax=Actinoplanes nipponensis TaxID=135950 RepID=A0A919MLN2_9ACTN|nr:flavodoxin domain-containing protein [Actinoplanes nipponensis]GIE54124.1 flavodoxin [Actinoplanes nipponensis]
MKALVVYESMFGNTEKVARAIADGLSGMLDVTLADVGTMPRALDFDLLVIGGPTHAFGMSRPSTREQAAQQAHVRPGATAVGVREYLDCSPQLAGLPAAAFDTKIDKPLLPGSARRIQRRLRRLGCRIVQPARSFLVGGTTGPLGGQEPETARQWGTALAAALTADRHTV